MPFKSPLTNIHTYPGHLGPFESPLATTPRSRMYVLQTITERKISRQTEFLRYYIFRLQLSNITYRLDSEDGYQTGLLSLLPTGEISLCAVWETVDIQVAFL